MGTAARAQDAAADVPQTPQEEAAAQERADDAEAAARDQAPPPSVPAGGGAQGGNGFALSSDGQARLHLGIDAGAGFDTNPYSVPADVNDFNGDLAVRVRPRFDVNYPGSMISFTGNGKADYGFLPGLVEPDTRNFLLYQTQLGATLEVNRGAALRFAIADAFSWNNDPGFTSLGTVFNRITNNARVGVGYTPGGGALSFKFAYDFQFVKYLALEPEISQSSEDLDNMTHSVSARADYRFLPKTGLFSSVSAGFNGYVSPDRDPNATPSSFPVQVNLGVMGQILAKLAGRVSVGYSNPLVVDEGQLTSGGVLGVTGQAEVQWVPIPTTRLGGGLRRGITPAPLYEYVANNRFYFAGSHIFAGRFQLRGAAGYSYMEFGTEQLQRTTASTGRQDGHLDATAMLDYFFTDWMSVGLSTNFDWRTTNANDPSGFNLGFVRQRTFLLASVRY